MKMKTLIYKSLLISLLYILTLLPIYSCSFTEDFEQGGKDEEFCMHEITEYEAKEPTCQEVGWEKYEVCSKCGYTTYKEIPRTKHTYHHYFCTECNDELKASEGLTFVSTGFGICNVSSIGSCEDTNLVIPIYAPDGSVVMGIEANAFENAQNIISVTLPETIESIGDDAFSGCDRIFEVINYSSLEIIQGTHSHGKISYNAELIHTGELKYKTTAKDGFVFANVEGTNFLVAYIGNEKKITLPESYNNEQYKIHRNAFMRNPTLESVTISEGVFEIEFQAFSECMNLKEVYVSKNVEAIGQAAFWFCENLEKVFIEDGVLYIGHEAFAGCTKLSQINLPNTVTSLGEKVFAFCSSLKELVLPNKIDCLDLRIFSYCQSLESIVIPNSVSRIVGLAFEYCISLKDVTIGSGVESISASAFESCTSLENISVSESNKFYTSIDGSLYSKDGKTILRYAVAKKDISFVIPESVKKIEKYAFAFSENLTSITLGKGVTEIGEYAFNNTKIFEVINHSDLNITAGSDAYGEIAFSAIEVHNGESKIALLDDYVFGSFENQNYLLNYLGADKDITLPESFGGKSYYIKGRAFEYKDIRSVTIPKSVIGIKEGAFLGCGNLFSVKFLGNIPIMEDYAFSYCERLVEVIAPNASILEIGSYGNGTVACYAKILHSGESKISKIGDFVFLDSDSKVYLVAYLGNDESVSLPDSFDGREYVINTYAFMGYETVKSIFVSSGVIGFEDNAFYTCYNLQNIVINKSVKLIGIGAFYITDLKNVYYGGTKNDFLLIDMDKSSNEDLFSSDIYYYSENEPAENGRFWHFDEAGNVSVW